MYVCRSNDGEDVGTLVHTLKPGTTRLYTWDYPLCVQELFWQILAANSDTKRGTLRLKVRLKGCENGVPWCIPTQDANGEVQYSQGVHCRDLIIHHL